jgi:hypothetical protein
VYRRLVSDDLVVRGSNSSFNTARCSTIPATVARVKRAKQFLTGPRALRLIAFAGRRIHETAVDEEVLGEGFMPRGEVDAGASMRLGLNRQQRDAGGRDGGSGG